MPAEMRRVFLGFPILLMLFSCSSDKALTGSGGAGSNGLSERDRMEVTSLFFDAQRQKQLGNLYNARKILEQILQKDPENDAALYDIARISAGQNEYAEALGFAERATAKDPENVWYQKLLADLYLSNGRIKDAESTYERIIETDPTNLFHYHDLSMLRYQSGDIEGAIKALKALEDELGYSEEVFQQKQMFYIESGQTTKARTELEEALEVNPMDPVLLRMMADMYEAEGNEEKALEYYERILSFDPENGMVHLSLYEYYMKKNELDKATESILLGFQDELIPLDSKMGIMISFYESSERDSSLRQQALLLCDKLVEVYPDEAKSHSMLGDFLIREGRYEEARGAFLNAVDLDPSKSVIWTQILALDSQLEDYQALQDDSQEALELFPASPDYYLLNGIAKNQLGDHQGAIRILKSGKSLVIDNDALLSDFYSNLGDAYNSEREYSESDKAFEKALEIQPDNIYVLNNYAYYLALRGERLERAVELAEKVNRLAPGSDSFEDTYAWALYKNGDFKEAKKWIEKAMEHGGSQSGTVIEHYGDILYRNGKEKEALEQWQRAAMFEDISEFLQQKIKEGRLIE